MTFLSDNREHYIWLSYYIQHKKIYTYLHIYYTYEYPFIYDVQGIGTSYKV